MVSAFSLQSLSLPWHFQNKLSFTIGTYRQLHGNSSILSGQLSCLWLDGHSGLLMKHSVKTSQQNCLNQLKSTVVVRSVLSGACSLPIVKQVCSPYDLYFINTWNDYFMQLVMLTSMSKLDYLTRGCNHTSRNGNQLWFDHSAALAAVPIVTNRLPCLPKILHSRDYYGSC